MTIESRVLIMISKIFTGLCDTQIWLCQKLCLRPFTLLTPYMDEFLFKRLKGSAGQGLLHNVWDWNR